jgi:prevent-host-death family protein
MTVHVNIAKAKATLSELVARAEAGEEVVLTRNGKPVATLVSHDQRRRRRAGAWAHLGKLDDPYLFLRPDRELEEMMDAPILPPE